MANRRDLATLLARPRFGVCAALLASSCGGHADRMGGTAGAGGAARGGSSGSFGEAGAGGTTGDAGTGFGGAAGYPHGGGGGSIVELGGESARGGSSAAGASGMGEPPTTIINGPGGTTIVVPTSTGTLAISDNCADVPAGIYNPPLGTCLKSANGSTWTGEAEVCFPNPTKALDRAILRCTATQATPACAANADSKSCCIGTDRLFGGKCFTQVPIVGAQGSDPSCAFTTPFTTIAVGSLADEDGDFVPDFEDNCPTIPNLDQSDTNHDGVGDACELDGGVAGAAGGQ